MNLKRILCLILLLTVIFTLAACKKDKECTVIFNSNGGSQVSNQIVKIGSTVSCPANPTRDGYTFLGWYYGDEKWDFSTPLNGDVTLDAKWEEVVIVTPPACTDHIDSNKDGKCDKCQADVPVDPDVDPGDNPGDNPGVDPDADKIYTITYREGDTNKKLSLKPNSYTILDTDLKLPTPSTRAHYEFVGWYTDKEMTNLATSIDVTAKANITFYAKYVPIPYTLTYELNDGVNADTNPTSYDYSNLPLTLADPTKEGYNFRGWYTDFAFTQPITEINSTNIGNLTLYARWAAAEETYTITYLDNNGEVIAVDNFFKSDSDQPIRDGSEIEEIQVEGFAFIAWVDANDESIRYHYIPAGTNTNLVVKPYIRSTVTHNILYFVNSGTTYFATERFIEVEGHTEFLSAAKAGYTFDGWYTDPACTNKITSIPANTTTDVILYGEFIANTYSVKFYDADGSELTFDLNEYSTSEEPIPLPAVPEKYGYIALGWVDAEGNVMEENQIAAEQYGNLELTAKYTKVTYKVEYYLNGGINDSNNCSEYLFEEIPTLYDPAPRSGYKFAGWYLDATFSGIPVEDLDDPRCANQNISLFALWIPDIEEDNSTLTPEVPF